MNISILIPVFNEERTVSEIIKQVQHVQLPGYEKEVIVIDDCSTDRTAEILSQVSVKVVRHERNLGKGAAIQTGLKNATGEVILIQDADLEYPPENYAKLLTGLEHADAVFGDRGVKRWPERGLHYVLGAKLLTWTLNILYGSNLKDLYTGAKVLKASALKNISLTSSGFEFEAEITAKLLKAGVKIVEVPISYHPRSVSEGKKISWSDFFRGLWVIVRCRFA